MALGRRSRTRRSTAAVTDSAAPAKTKTPLDAKRAKRLIGVGTAMAPLLAPYALAIAGSVRGAWDAHRAARLGVEAGELAAYSGPGGALHARLSRVAEALNELEAKKGDDAGNGTGGGGTGADAAFATTTRPRLADLAVAVRAAEQMPATRRRTAYRSIGDELDRIEIALLTRLGVVTT